MLLTSVFIIPRAANYEGDILLVSDVRNYARNTEYDFIIDRNKIDYENLRSESISGDWIKLTEGSTFNQMWGIGSTSQTHTVKHGYGVNVGKTSPQEIDGEINLVFKDAAKDKQGNFYDVQVRVYDGRAINYGQKTGVHFLCGWDHRDKKEAGFMFCTYKLGSSNKFGARLKYQITIQDKNGVKQNGTFNYIATDLDIKWQAAPSYPESVKFLSGANVIALDKNYKSSGENNHIEMEQDGDYVRFQPSAFHDYGYSHDYQNGSWETQYANIPYSGVFANLNSGAALEWRGSGCNSFLFFDFGGGRGNLKIIKQSSN